MPRRGDSRKSRKKHEVFPSGELVVQRDLLRRETEVHPHGRIRWRTKTEEIDGSRIRCKQPGRDRDRRRLSCTVGAEQPEDLTRADFKREPIDGNGVAEPFADVADRKHEGDRVRNCATAVDKSRAVVSNRNRASFSGTNSSARTHRPDCDHRMGCRRDRRSART